MSGKYVPKGELISKAIYGLLTSPKNERMSLFSLLFYSSRQTKQIRPFVFLGESTARQSAFRFYLTFKLIIFNEKKMRKI